MELACFYPENNAAVKMSGQISLGNPAVNFFASALRGGVMPIFLYGTDSGGGNGERMVLPLEFRGCVWKSCLDLSFPTADVPVFR